MRNEVHTRSSFILVAAALIAVALPVAVLFSREDDAASDALERVEAAAPLPAYSIAPIAMVPTGAAAANIDGTEWTGDALESASMVLVGSLLIGLGSIVRRAA
jgi:hypothetical protein